MDSKHDAAYAQIGLNILYYRKRCGMTQQQLAEQANYSRNHIQQIERGNTVPSVDALLNIAQALHVTVEQLFCAAPR